MNRSSRTLSCLAGFFLAFLVLCSSALAVKPPLEHLDYGFEAHPFQVGGEMIGEHINILMGNMVETAADVSFPSPHRQGFSFKRTYNSRAETSGILGYGWTHNFEATIALPTESEPYLRIIDGEGRAHYFQQESSTIFRGIYQERSFVAVSAAGNYTWKCLDGTQVVFLPSTRLFRIIDPVYINSIYFTYDTQGRLSTARDGATNRILIFNYNAGGLLDNITGPASAAVTDGVWVRFAYDADSNLTSVTYPDGSGFTYEYEPAAAHNLTRKRNKMSHILGEWSYDAEDRCYSHSNQYGGSVTLSYAGSSQVDSTDVYGRVRTYSIAAFGGRGRVTRAAGPSNAPYGFPNISSWTYDDQARITQIDHAGGTIDRFENFDSRGNPQTITLASGDPKERVITYTYHSLIITPLSRTEASVLGSGNKVTT